MSQLTATQRNLLAMIGRHQPIAISPTSSTIRIESKKIVCAASTLESLVNRKFIEKLPRSSFYVLTDIAKDFICANPPASTKSKPKAPSKKREYTPEQKAAQKKRLRQKYLERKLMRLIYND